MRKMTGLLYKNLMLMRGTIIAVFGGITAAYALSVFPLLFRDDESVESIASICFVLTDMMIVTCFFVFALLTTGIAKYDERKIWAHFILSTPDAEKAQVRCIYESNLILCIAGYLWQYLLLSISQCFYHTENSLGFLLLETLFFFNIFCCAVETVFMIRFGSTHANNVRAIPLLILFLIAMLYLLFGDLGALNQDTLGEETMKLVTGERKLVILPLIRAIFPFVSIILYILSYKLSCKLYRKGAETYVK